LERLSASDLSVAFEGVNALSRVSLTLARGEVLGLIGPNGAGKTTLVNVLSGFQPAEGRIEVAGRDVTGLTPMALGRLGVVRTFQGARLFAGLSVIDNITIGALGRGIGLRRARSEAAELGARLGLEPFAAAEAGSLPFGIERRVGLARALAMKPRFLLLDEPAAGLGEGEAEAFARLVRDVRSADECGILIIEHNMPLVMGLCERVQVLASGQTIAIGTPEEVKANPGVRSAYLGTGAA
jgi:branched-chain amino acid transport system ATP-binding protein